MADDRSQIVRKEAVKALGGVDHPKLEEVLRLALSDRNAKVQRWAQRGLEMVTGIKVFMEPPTSRLS